MKNKINSADYLLLLLYLNNNEAIEGSTRIMKMMFLFDKEILPLLSKFTKQTIRHTFEYYKFGVFSKDVYEQIELFKSLKFISIKSNIKVQDMSILDNYEENEIQDMSSENNIDDNNIFKLNNLSIMYKYKILKNGIKYVEEKINPNLDENDLKLLEKFKSKITSITIKNILYYTYIKYPWEYR